MRAAEAAGAFVSDRLRPRDAADPESYKARRGRVGSFVDYLAPVDRAWVDARIAAELAPWFAAYRC